MNYRPGEAKGPYYLGLSEEGQQKHQAAIACFQKALAIYQTIGDKIYECNCWHPDCLTHL